MLLACVIAGYSSTAEKTKQADNTAQVETEQGGNSLEEQEFEVDAYEDVTALVKDYYKYYAKGDVDSLEKIAYPISDTEKSYIKMFSKHVDKYSDIKCYTKKGVSEGEFAASVRLNMKFKGVKTEAPGLDFFYIRTDEKGNYYIDNAYGEFNQSNQENTLDQSISALVDEFEQDSDVIALQKEVQAAYNDAIESDPDLESMVAKTQEAISDWVTVIGKQDKKTDASDESTDAEGKDTDKKDAEEKDTKADDANTEEDTKADDTNTKEENKDNETKTEEKTRTIYAKTAVNLRKKGSTDSKVLDTVKKGAKLTMYGNSKDGWCKVSYKGQTGYVMKKYVVFDKAELEKAEEKTRTMYAKTAVNLRKKSSTDSKVLRTVKKGAKLTMYGNSKDGWCKVSYKGDTGYVRREYIVTSKSKIKNSSKQESKNENNKEENKSIFIPEGKKIELSQTVNVRAAMNAESELVGVAYRGEVVTVVMSYTDGWTKVLWNDITGYIKSEYLQ